MTADLWTVAAERAARWWAAKGKDGASWREWVGVAWEGVARRAASRARRGLPPMDDRQVHLAARSALVDEVRKGEGGFATARNHAAPLLTPLSVLGDEMRDAAPARESVLVEFDPPTRRGRWTPDEDRLARGMVRRGCSSVEVSAALGRGGWSAIKRLERLKVPVGPRGRAVPNVVLRGQILHHLSEGLSCRAVARRLGQSVGSGSVWKVARKLVEEGLLVKTGGYRRPQWLRTGGEL